MGDEVWWQARVCTLLDLGDDSGAGCSSAFLGYLLHHAVSFAPCCTLMGRLSTGEVLQMSQCGPPA